MPSCTWPIHFVSAFDGDKAAEVCEGCYPFQELSGTAYFASAGDQILISLDLGGLP